MPIKCWTLDALVCAMVSRIGGGRHDRGGPWLSGCVTGPELIDVSTACAPISSGEHFSPRCPMDTERDSAGSGGLTKRFPMWVMSGPGI